jgi:hypothetical protein
MRRSIVLSVPRQLAFPGPNVIKLFTVVFVSGKPFQLSLMFDGKAGAYPIEEPFGCSTIR